MGRTRTTWESKSTWHSGKTTLIRVPISLKNQILDYARAVDSKLINNNPQIIPLSPGDFLLEAILETIDRYIEHKRQNYHPNQNSRKLDTSTRSWDELRKFKLYVSSAQSTL